MDEHAFESSKHEITGEHAVKIPALSTVNSLMPYVEAVAVVIGSCHIHSVYEDQDHIKIYLKDKRFVDILVNNGVSILGRQINVDYVVPRADKIILTNVDPIVPDSVIMKLLCYYGTPVSAVIHEKIANNSEYSHIECGKRKVYMNILPDKKIPTPINFTYQNMFYRIDVLVEPLDDEVICEPPPVLTPAHEENIDEDLNDVEEESSINTKPDVQEMLPKRKHTQKQLAYHKRGKSKTNSASKMVHRLKRQARKGWYGTRNAMAHNNLTQKKKEKLKIAVRKHLVAEGKRKLRTSSIPLKVEASSQNNSIVEENTSSSSNYEPKDTIDQVSPSIKEISEHVTQYPLSIKELMEFMKKTRFHRDPCQIAWEFLNDKTPESLEALKIQLREFCQATKDQGLKLRLRRILASLKFTKNSND